jgi:hypothetical protein
MNLYMKIMHCVTCIVIQVSEIFKLNMRILRKNFKERTLHFFKGYYEFKINRLIFRLFILDQLIKIKRKNFKK